MPGADDRLGGIDTITDFQSGVDKIDLSALHTSASDNFKIVTNGGNTYVEVDQRGDGTIDAMIRLTGANVVKASDIVLGNAPATRVAHEAIAADHVAALHHINHMNAHDLAAFG